MKKIVASVGLVALGASGIQSVSAQTLTSPDTSKMWSVAATLRGFYDDNTSTLPNNATVPAGYHRGSFGFEISPSAALAWTLEQTTINLGVLYSFKYYENTPIGTTSHHDQVFTFNAGLSHAFSETLKGRVSDSFVIGQEPDLLRAGNTFSTFQRVSGDNIRNYGSIGLDAQLSPQFGLGLGYDNSYYHYTSKEIGLTPAGFTDFFGNPVLSIVPSVAGTLNRMEQRAHIEGLWGIQPDTKLLLGYRFTDISYDGDQLIGGYVQTDFFGNVLPGVIFPVMSDTRDNRQHTVYVGAMHDFTPQLSGAVRVGASYSDYYNDPGSSAKYTPYVDANLRFTYAPESSVTGGISYDRNATDVIGFFGGSFAQDAESAVVYATVNHRIGPNLFANLMGQFQNSMISGGGFDDVSEQYYLAGLDLEYRFNPYFSTHAGYNYDRLESKVNGRGFDRNRVYVGITASY